MIKMRLRLPESAVFAHAEQMQHITPASILQQARLWIGTPFLHAGRTRSVKNKTGGADCIGLVLGVARELHLCAKDGKALTAYDYQGYGRSGRHLLLQKEMHQRLCPVSHEEALQSGDILLFRIGKYPQHVGFFVREEKKALIHAYESLGHITEHALSSCWERRIDKAFRFPALSCICKHDQTT